MGARSNHATSGVPASALADSDLLRELASVHRTRHTTLRHGSDPALVNHDQRTEELEREYLRRFPDREIDPERLAEGARARDHPGRWRTGADQPWDPADFAVAAGRDPTPENIEWARRRLAERDRAAVERIVP
jgi:hypothetical protein